VRSTTSWLRFQGQDEQLMPIEQIFADVPAARVARLIGVYREMGIYLRRKNPIPQLGGQLFSVREQRSHARS
jgi:hypothetical protein